MRTRGFHPWCTDRPILRTLHPAYTHFHNGVHGGVAGFRYGCSSGFGFRGSGGLAGPGSDQRYLVLSIPFKDREQLESMRRQWQQLPNWKSATVEGLTWEGTADGNARKYVNFVGVCSQTSDALCVALALRRPTYTER
jgi:hypothetical protein